jgi:phosphoadenosine phosphosulfate reductase
MSSERYSEHLGEVSARLETYRRRGLALFATSSFQTNSVVLLHMLSLVGRDVPVYFLNTGYHFPETLTFRDQLALLLGLEVVTLASPVSRLQQRDSDARLLFASDPDRCCELNKVQPLEPVLVARDVWITGLRASQSLARERMAVEEPARHGVLRYSPLLSWSSLMIEDYIDLHGLPRHPLEGRGYRSVGCQPCTRPPDPASAYDDRTGRWFGLRKTECGLHGAPSDEE